MSLNVAFYYPDNEIMVALWDNILRAYNVDSVSVISDVDEIGPWSRINTFQDISGPKVFFSPLTAVHFPGTVDLANLDFPEDITVDFPKDVTLCFGADEKHNEVEPCDEVVYIHTPKRNAPLFAVQAAIIVLAQVT